MLTSKGVLSISTNSTRVFQTCLLIAYLFGAPIFSVFNIIMGEVLATIAVNFLIGGLLICTALLKRKGKLFYPIVIYVAVCFFIILTLIVHPEYEPWYVHETYGIAKMFVDLRSGIAALFIFSLYDNEEELFFDLKLVAVLVFFAYSGRFLLAMRRGYWIISSVDGTLRHESYNMDFGYRMLYPAALFGAIGFIKNKNLYIALYFLCFLMILIGGSRGPALWAAFVIPMVIICRYPSLPTLQRKKAIALLLWICVIIVAFIIEKDSISMFAYNLAQSAGIKSRTLTALLTGSMMEGNGRDAIYGIAIDLIKTGGLFGHGFYGDRLTIGQSFRWGYSHNIFLEIFVQFGYVGGIILSLLLFAGIIRLYRKCKDTTSQIVFITVIICSLRLLVSNSFWYETWFWAAVALALSDWNRSQNKLSLQ